MNVVVPRLHKIQQGIIFGVIMESIMAIVTTLNFHGWMAVESFFANMERYFCRRFAYGYLFSILMSLVIKRCLAAYWAKA